MKRRVTKKLKMKVSSAAADLYMEEVKNAVEAGTEPPKLSDSTALRQALENELGSNVDGLTKTQVEAFSESLLDFVRSKIKLLYWSDVDWVKKWIG